LPPGTAAPHRLPSSLTRRGWGILVGAVVAGFAAGVFGIGELYPIAVAGIVLVAWSMSWSSLRGWRIDVGRQLETGRVEAGRSATVVLNVANRSARPAPLLTVRDPFDGGARTTDLVVAPLGPGERRSGTYRLPPTGRGVFTLGPLAVESTDPLGLARRVRTSTHVSTFLVHPRVEHVRAPRVGAGTERDRTASLAAPGRDNDEFASLREYQPGDDIRRMHWASTARTDTLMVREDQLEREGKFGVVVDTRLDMWSAASFERAISTAASLACAALRAGVPTRLVTTGGVDSGWGRGQHHRDHILDLLAGARTHEGPQGTDAGAPRGRPTRSLPVVPIAGGGTIALVLSDRGDGDDLRRTVAVDSTTDVILVEIQTSRPAGRRPAPPRPAPGTRVVRVGPTTPLAAVWDAVA
jgi:uncharacterized protein (DUF58 family)